jgi:hypothetical protein
MRQKFYSLHNLWYIKHGSKHLGMEGGWSLMATKKAATKKAAAKKPAKKGAKKK